MSFVVLDFETTGLMPSLHRVIEVGAAVIENGLIVDTFQELCNPGVKIPSFITKFTGISNDMLVDKPTPEQVMSKLHKFIGSRPIIAHNASFDSKFLLAEMKRIKKSVPNTFLCTLLLSRRLLQGLSSYKLSFLKAHLGYKARANHCDHRALDDVLVTVHLWNHLFAVLHHHGMAPVSTETLVAITKLPKKSVPEYLQRFGGKRVPAPVELICSPTADESTPPRKRKWVEVDSAGICCTEEKKGVATPTTPIGSKIALRRSPRSVAKTTDSCKKVRLVIDLTNTTPGKKRSSARRLSKEGNSSNYHSSRNHNSKKIGSTRSSKEHPKRRCSTLLDIFKACKKQ